MAASVAALAVGGAAAVWQATRPTATATAQDAPAAREFVAVERRDLVREETLKGQVDRGALTALPLTAGGIITRLPDVGSVIGSGQPLVEVDGHPIVLLAGDRPAWRALQPGMGKGEDVRQLETALVGLGYATADELTVDDTWSSATTTAVKAMQKGLVMPVDGRFELGEIVFAPDPVRVAKIGGSLGSPASAAGIEVSAVDQLVSASLPATDADLLAVGDDVQLKLPTGERVAATVTDIGVPRTADDGSVSMQVTVSSPDLQAADGTPVTVQVSVVEAKGALAVPAAALLALTEGGYALEVADESAASGVRLVGVDVGVFADGWVEVTGDIAEGDRVVTS